MKKMSWETQSKIEWHYLGIVTLPPPLPRTKPGLPPSRWIDIDYRAYIRSPAWRALKKAFLRSHMPKNCIGCWKPYHSNFELHHRTYVRLGLERLTDLCLLCRICHQAVHDRYTAKQAGETLRTATRRAIRQIRKKSLKQDPSKATRPDYTPRPPADCDIWRTIGADCPWNPTPGVRVVQHITSLAEARRLGLR